MFHHSDWVSREMRETLAETLSRSVKHECVERSVEKLADTDKYEVVPTSKSATVNVSDIPVAPDKYDVVPTFMCRYTYTDER